jgi:carotenoid 1,2-hydratase
LPAGGDRGPSFDRLVPDGGYRWHYLDAVSDDGQLALVVIAMVGNPFSPRYARAREHGPASAMRYASMNVALYGRSRAQHAWTLEERTIVAEDCAPTRLALGRSAIYWQGDRLIIDVDERTTSVFSMRRRLRGRIVFYPEVLSGLELAIDAQGLHRWWPLAPLGRLEAKFAEPDVRFSAPAYCDANAGDVALDESFSTWSWSRARGRDAAYLTYDVQALEGDAPSHALRVSKHGPVTEIDTTISQLGRSRWGLERMARADRGATPQIVRSFEDGPFYTRASIRTRLGGETVRAMHETLAAHRLRRGWVRFCTGYRMRFSP